MKKLLGALLVCILFVTPAVADNGPTVAVESIYEVAEEGVTVRATHRLVPSGNGNISLRLPISGINEPVLSPDGSDSRMEVSHQETTDDPVPYTTFSFQALDTTPLVLSFTTDRLVREFGDNLVFALPAMSEQTTVSLNAIELDVPVERGMAVQYGVEAAGTTVDGNRQLYRFEPIDDQPLKVVSLFGAAVTANAKWETRLSNGGWWWRHVQLVLPPDTNQQTVHLNSLTPQPTRMSVDRDGNLIASYRIGPKQSVTVTAEASINMRSSSYNTTNTRTLADIPEQLAEYVRDSAIPGDSVVVEAVEKRLNEVHEDTTNSDNAAERLVETISRDGIPARQVQGLRFIQQAQLVDNFTSASWVEVFVPGIGWMTVDPADDMYGESDYLRLATHIGSPVSEVDGAVSTEGLSLTFNNEPLPEIDYSSSHTEIVKYPILPWVSLVKSRVAMPAGTVLDQTAISGGGIITNLGSLAPLQQVSHWNVLVGQAAYETGEAEFGRGGEGGIGEVLATGPVNTSYWPIAFLVVGLVIFIWRMIKWRRSHSRVGKLPGVTSGSSSEDIRAEDLLRR